MRVALDRAQAAGSAGAGLWFVRQANASAEYALLDSSLLARFPALEAALVKAFVADALSVSLTPAQSAAAKAKLLRHLPTPLTKLLAVAAAPYQPATVPEVAALKAAILDTAAFRKVVANLAPKTVLLPSAFASSSVTASEVRLVAELKQYADGVLQPVPSSALPKMAGRLEPFAECGGEDELGEAAHIVADGYEAISDAFENLGGEAGEAAAAGPLGLIGMALGYGFAIVAFNDVGKAFQLGGEGGGGEGGGSSGGSSGGEGAGGCGGGANAASAGDPHQMTFSGADYDFQAAGEFTLVKSTTDDLDIQVRQQPFPGAASIAVDTATAMHVGTTIVELGVNASGDLQLWVDRHPVAYASRELAGGGQLSVQNPLAATVTWPDGTTVSVFTINTTASPHHVLTCNTKHAINLTIRVPQSRFGHLEGLLGDPGKPPGELVGGNGTTYNMEELAEPWQSAHDF